MVADWRPGDRVRAEALYASLSGYTKAFFDLIMDHPGEGQDADQIVAYFAKRNPDASKPPNRLSLAASLTPVWQKCANLDRPPPYHRQAGTQGAASVYTMKPAVALLFRAARAEADPAYAAKAGRTSWSGTEISAVVASYLEMLSAETAGRTYSKSVHRRKLLHQLQAARTESAIELKYQNISAAMLDLGLPYIRGYKPRRNYQAALIAEIQRRVDAAPQLLHALGDFAEGDAPPGSQLRRTQPPKPAPPPRTSPAKRDGVGRHRDYGLLQEENSRRGRQGERLVVDYERAWLGEQGRDDLADCVTWAADKTGDGLGYDVISFDLAGRERYIEVKTTALGEDIPFFITAAEMIFAQRNADQYALYRVYDVLDEPRFFALEGDITGMLTLTPVTYSARIAVPPPGP